MGPTQWRIQDFPQGGAPTTKSAIIFQIFVENCMKMKEFGPPGGARVPGAPLRSANATISTSPRCETWPTTHATDIWWLSGTPVQTFEDFPPPSPTGADI